MQPAAGEGLDPDHTHVSFPSSSRDFFLPQTDDFLQTVMYMYPAPNDEQVPPPDSPISTSNSSSISSEHVCLSPSPMPPFFNFPASHRGLNVYSNNINHANYIGHLTLNNLAVQADLVLLQEPNWGFIGRARADHDPDGLTIFGTTSQRSWNAIHPSPTSISRSDFRPRVFAYTNRVSDATCTLRSDLIEHGDIMALEVHRKNLNCLIINLYNDEHNTAVDLLYRAALPQSTPTIITGDFNLHHPNWSPEHCPESPHADC